MNMLLRNFPKPQLSVVHTDCGLSERREIVARICEYTNELMEYYFGLEVTKLLIPAQSNVDERMPLYFLRPCVEQINAIICDAGLDVELLPLPTNNMDYHFFVPWTRQIVETLNIVIKEL